MVRHALHAGLSIALALAIGVGSGWAADEKPARKPGGAGQGPSPERRAEMMKRFDKNGNGQLDPDEMQAAREAMQKFQAAGGGKPGAGGAGPSPERMKELVAKFDKNGDGSLDDAEKQAAKAEFMKMQGGQGAGGNPGAGRPGAGKPGEGKPAGDFGGREAAMKRFDKNGDGKLDDAEKAAAKEAIQKFQAAGGKPGQGRPQGKKPEAK